MLNESIGPFVLQQEIGSGRLGAVYRAVNTSGGSETALKVFSRFVYSDPTLFARLSRESDLLQMLQAPGLLPVRQVLETEESLCLEMPLCSGGNLRDRLAAGPLPVESAAAIIVRLAQALQAAHAVGVLHGNLKPSNVLFDEQNRAYLSDFGSRKIAMACAQPGAQALFGPPAYFSPEQAAGNEGGPASDVYMLGALFFEMLTGETPFHSAGILGFAVQRLVQDSPDPRTLRSDLPEWCCQVLQVALRRNPESRWSSPAEFAQAVEDGQGGKPLQFPQGRPEETASHEISSNTKAGLESDWRQPARRSRGFRRWGLAAVLTLLLAAAAWFLWTAPSGGAFLAQAQRSAARLLAQVAPREDVFTPTPTLLQDVAQAAVAATSTPAADPSPQPEKTPNLILPVSPTLPVLATFTPTPAAPAPTQASSPTPAQIAALLPLSPTPAGGLYTIQYNETLFNIASHFGSDLSYLISINDISCDSRLLPGKQLYVPPAGIDQFLPSFVPINMNSSQRISWQRILDCVQDVRDVAFSPDGRILALAQDNMIYFWQVGSWTPLLRLKGHQGDVTKIVFSPDGKLLASGAEDRTVRLWWVEDGSLMQTLSGHRSVITGLAFSPDGKTLVSTSTDETARRWDVASGKTLDQFRGYKTFAAAYSPDGSLLAIGYADSAGLYDGQSGAKIASLPASAKASQLAFSPDGSLLASSSDIWQVQEQKVIYHLTKSANDIAFTPDGGALIVGRRFYRIDNGTILGEFKNPLPQPEHLTIPEEVISLSSDARLLAYGTQEGLSIWGEPGDEIANAPESGEDGHVVVSGDTFANIAEQYDVSLKDLLNQNKLSCKNVIFSGQKLSLPGKANDPLASASHMPISPASAVALKEFFRLDKTCAGEISDPFFSPDNRSLISGTGMWRLDRNSLLVAEDNASTQVESTAGVLLPSPVMAFSPDGALLAVRSGSEIKLWDVSSGRLIKTLSGHTQKIAGLAFSPDGSVLVTGGGTEDKSLRWWSMPDGELLHVQTGFSAKNLRFTADGQILVAGWDDTIRFWNMQDYSLRGSLSGILGGLRLSPDGKFLVFIACNKKEGDVCTKQVANVYRLSDGNIGYTFQGLKETIQNLEISPDSRLLAVASGYSVILWDIERQEIAAKLIPTENNRTDIQDLYFSPDGSLLITQDSGGYVRVWNTQSNVQVYGLRMAFDSIAFSPDETLLAVRTGNNISVWGIP